MFGDVPLSPQSAESKRPLSLPRALKVYTTFHQEKQKQTSSSVVMALHAFGSAAEAEADPAERSEGRSCTCAELSNPNLFPLSIDISVCLW